MRISDWSSDVCSSDLRFEFFILSDSNAENGEIERTAYLKMRRGFSRPVHYRRRALNVGRKPGNIAEWVERFGGASDYMLVLDADSVMSEIGRASCRERVLQYG